MLSGRLRSFACLGLGSRRDPLLRRARRDHGRMGKGFVAEKFELTLLFPALHEQTHEHMLQLFDHDASLLPLSPVALQETLRSMPIIHSLRRIVILAAFARLLVIL